MPQNSGSQIPGFWTPRSSTRALSCLLPLPLPPPESRSGRVAEQGLDHPPDCLGSLLRFGPPPSRATPLGSMDTVGPCHQQQKTSRGNPNGRSVGKGGCPRRSPGIHSQSCRRSHPSQTGKSSKCRPRHATNYSPALVYYSLLLQTVPVGFSNL